jgi:hypothetical protein
MAGGIVQRFSGAGNVLKYPGAGVGTAFKKGDLVDISNGTVIIGASTTVRGIAMTDDKASADIEVELIDHSAIYIMYFTGTLAATLVGDYMDVTYTTTAQTAIAYSSTADVYCVGLYDAVGTVNGRILVKFKYTSMVGHA